MIPEIIKIIAIIVLVIFIIKTTKFIFKSIIFIVLLLFIVSFFYPSFPLETFKLGVKEKVTETVSEKVAEKVEESKDLADCKLNQGIWQKNKEGEHFCNLPTQDQNKTCFNSEECEGICIAINETTGRCQDYSYIEGCFNILTNNTSEEICFN